MRRVLSAVLIGALAAAPIGPAVAHDPGSQNVGDSGYDPGDGGRPGHRAHPHDHGQGGYSDHGGPHYGHEGYNVGDSGYDPGDPDVLARNGYGWRGGQSYHLGDRRYGHQGWAQSHPWGYAPRHYRHGYVPYHHDRDDDHEAFGVIAGVFLGIILGAALVDTRDNQAHAHSRLGDPDWIHSCSRRYRSFDPKTGTYLGYDGRRHYCR